MYARFWLTVYLSPRLFLENLPKQLQLMIIFKKSIPQEDCSRINKKKSVLNITSVIFLSHHKCVTMDERSHTQKWTVHSTLFMYFFF